MREAFTIDHIVMHKLLNAEDATTVYCDINADGLTYNLLLMAALGRMFLSLHLVTTLLRESLPITSWCAAFHYTPLIHAYLSQHAYINLHIRIIM